MWVRRRSRGVTARQAYPYLQSRGAPDRNPPAPRGGVTRAWACGGAARSGDASMDLSYVMGFGLGTTLALCSPCCASGRGSSHPRTRSPGDLTESNAARWLPLRRAPRGRSSSPPNAVKNCLEGRLPPRPPLGERVRRRGPAPRARDRPARGPPSAQGAAPGRDRARQRRRRARRAGALLAWPPGIITSRARWRARISRRSRDLPRLLRPRADHAARVHLALPGAHHVR